MKKTCPHCNASMMEYRHRLNRPLVEALDRLACCGRPTKITELLTGSQWVNFQKLRYWSVVEKTGHAGVWAVTNLGLRFLGGVDSLPKSVWTYRGEYVRQEDELVHVEDVIEGYQLRGDYAREARRVKTNGDQQVSLF